MDARRGGHEIDWCVGRDGNRQIYEMKVSYPDRKDSPGLDVMIKWEFERFINRVGRILNGEPVDKHSEPVFRTQNDLGCIECGGPLCIDNYCHHCNIFGR